MLLLVCGKNGRQAKECYDVLWMFSGGKLIRIYIEIWETNSSIQNVFSQGNLPSTLWGEKCIRQELFSFVFLTSLLRMSVFFLHLRRDLSFLLVKILVLWIPFLPAFSRIGLTLIILLYSVFNPLSNGSSQLINEVPFSKNKNIPSLDPVVLFLSYSFKPKFLRMLSPLSDHQFIPYAIMV